MSEIWVAVVDDGFLGHHKRQACATREAALHWLAWEAIPADSFERFWDAMDPEEKVGVSRDRQGMTDEQILAFWASPDPGEDDDWGDGDYTVRIERQDVYEWEPTDG